MSRNRQKVICGVTTRQLNNIIDRIVREEDGQCLPREAKIPTLELNPEPNHVPVDNLVIYEEEEEYTTQILIDDYIFREDLSDTDSECDIDLSEFVTNAYKSQFQTKLTEIFKRYQPSHEFIGEMLVLLKHNGFPDLPVTAKTLYKPEEPVEPIETRVIDGGEYWHHGIENAFKDWEASLFGDIVELDIFVDGFPITKSSRLVGWPILGGIPNRPELPVLLFGIYAGYGSPKYADDLLRDFAVEASLLQTSGIRIGPQKELKRFSLRCLLADCPARAYVLGVKYHSAKNGCQKCDQVGVYDKSDRTVRYQPKSAISRTDASFHERSDMDYHQKCYQNQLTILEKELNFPMVTGVPIDSMHCFDLGVTKKFIKDMLENKGKAFFPKKALIATMEQDFLKFKGHMTSDFVRKPRPFVEAAKFKAVECRQFLLYTGIVVLQPYLRPEIYQIFLNYFCAARLLHQKNQTDESLDVAQILLENFVEESVAFAPTTHNMHSLLHITDCVRQYGPLESFSNYKYENALQPLKKGIKKPTQIMQQVKNLVDRKMLYLQQHRFSKDEHFSELFIELSENDNFGLLRNGKIVEILQLIDDKLAVGRFYTDASSFFTLPYDSKEVFGICYVENKNPELVVFPTHDLVAKYLRLPLRNGYVMIPILHHLIN
jgi:hypothetical protein